MANPNGTVQRTNADDYLCINPDCLLWFLPADDDELFSNNNGSFCSAECQTVYDEWDL